MSMNPYYAPFYQPNFYGNQTAQNQQYQQPYQQPVVQPQQSGNGLIWVQGEAGAKSYMVVPGNTVMLMDSESERCYIKSAAASGMPLPLRVFAYQELTQQGVQAPAVAEQPNLNNFITREEFEQRIASLTSQKEVANNG